MSYRRSSSRSINHYSFLALGSLLISACAPTALPASSPTVKPSILAEPKAEPTPRAVTINIPSPSPLQSAQTQPASPRPSASGPAFEVIAVPAKPLINAQGTPTSLRFQLAGNPKLKVKQELCLVALALNDVGQPLNSNLELDWISSQPEIANVDSRGCVKSQTTGKTLIQVTSKGQPKLSTQLELEVSNTDKTSEKPSGFDFNGDHQPDYLIGSGKQLRLYLGEGQSLDLNQLKPERMMTFQFPEGATAAAKATFDTQTATGDLNGDGFDDLAIGHSYFGALGAIDIFFGSAYPRSFNNLSAPDLIIRPQSGNLAGQTYTSVTPGQAYDQVGRDVIIRDLDGDGFAELITGNPAFQTNGGVHIFKGQSRWPEKLSQRDASYSLTGVIHQDRRSLGEFGKTIALGEFNGDGKPDLVVMAPSDGVVGPYDDKGSKQLIDVGQIFIFLGDAAGWQNKTSAQASLSIKGLVSPDLNEFIRNLQVKDLNGDGKDELIVLGLQRSVDAVPVVNPATEMPENPVHFRSTGHVFYAEQLTAGSVLELSQARVQIGAAEEDFQSRLVIADLNQDGKPDLGIGETYSDQRSGLGLYDGHQLTTGAKLTRKGMYIFSEPGEQNWPSLLKLDTGRNGQQELYLASETNRSKLCLTRLELPTGQASIPSTGSICLP